jgi:hypothetical protein
MDAIENRVFDQLCFWPAKLRICLFASIPVGRKTGEHTGVGRFIESQHDAFYNWAIAISDQAKMRGRTKEAEEL